MYRKKNRIRWLGACLLIILLCMTGFPKTVNAATETNSGIDSATAVSVYVKNDSMNSKELSKVLEKDEEKVFLMADSIDNPTSTQNVTLKVGKIVRYGNWSTNYFYINDQLSYCLEPEKGTPDNGDHIAEILNNKALTKCLYYLVGGPGWSQEVRDAIFPKVFNDDTCYAVSHIIVSYAYNPNQDAFIGVDNDTMEGAINIYHALLNNYPDPPDGSLSITPNFRKAYWLEEHGRQFTDEFTITGAGNNVVKFTLPEGVQLHNWTTQTVSSGAVSVKGGDTFQFSANSDVSGTWNSGELKGTIDGKYTALVVEGGSDQDIGGLTYTKDIVSPISFSVEWLSQGTCQILKESANPEITTGNACYSLKDAQYDIFSDIACMAASKVGTMTTTEDGTSNKVSLNAGTYYVKETVAPVGYMLDKKVYPVTIKVGETFVLKVTDKPTMNPVGVLLGKVDKETNQNKPQGSATLEGALFTVKFYPGTPSNTDPGVAGKTPARTWVFKTNKNGFAEYNTQFLESGDELYIAPSGVPSLPLGTLTIQETQAPEGYLLNKELYVVPITSSNNGSEFVYTYNEPTVREQALSLNILKRANGKDIVLEGAVFEHTLPDGTKETSTTDAQGRCAFKGLTYGQHTIRELTAPSGYVVNTGIVKFTVAKDNTIRLDSNTAKDGSITFKVNEDKTASMTVEDMLAAYTLRLTKVNDGGKTLEGAEFTLYAEKECKTEVAKVTTGKDGLARFADMEVEKKYYLKETKAPDGYQISKTPDGKDVVYEIYTKYNTEGGYEYYVDGKQHTSSTGDFAITGTPDKREVNLKVVNQMLVRLPETGSPFTFGMPAVGVLCMAGAMIYSKKKQMREKNCYEKK